MLRSWTLGQYNDYDLIRASTPSWKHPRWLALAGVFAFSRGNAAP